MQGNLNRVQNQDAAVAAARGMPLSGVRVPSGRAAVSGVDAMTPDEAIAIACERAGFADFGADGWQDGLAHRLDAISRAPLTGEARRAAWDGVVADLINRLQVESWYLGDPGIADQTLDGPVVVCGLPGSGAADTAGMLATDPRFRILREWEGAQPVPPPLFGEDDNDPRAVDARLRAHAGDGIILATDPDGPADDFALIAALDMKGLHGAYPFPDEFTEWWTSADFTATYDYHKRVLKLLQSHCGPPLWMLKSPVHLFHLDTIAQVFPDAKFIWAHRDPAKSIPSIANLHYRLNVPLCEPGSLDKLDYGPKMLRFWGEAVMRALDARARIGEDRFIDLWKDDVASHPERTFARLYGKLGYRMTDDFRRGIEDYTARKEGRGRDKGRYSAEEYGISRDEIRWAFSEYIARFGL